MKKSPTIAGIDVQAKRIQIEVCGTINQRVSVAGDTSKSATWKKLARRLSGGPK